MGDYESSSQEFQMPYWRTTEDVLREEDGGFSEITCQEEDLQMLQPPPRQQLGNADSQYYYSHAQRQPAPRPFRIRRRHRPSTDYELELRREVIFELKLGTYGVALLSERVPPTVRAYADAFWLSCLASLLGIAGAGILLWWN